MNKLELSDLEVSLLRSALKSFNPSKRLRQVEERAFASAWRKLEKLTN